MTETKRPPLRILVADDDAIVGSAVSCWLESTSGVEVVGVATDGHEAVSLAAEHRPDVVLMDFSMPRLGGVEATRRIRQSLPDVRILGCFQHTDATSVRQMLKAGAHGFLPKASSAEVALAALWQVAGGERYLPQDVAAQLAELDSLPEPSPEGDAGALGSLSSREREVLQLLGDGYGIGEIAEQLGLGRRTVESHRHNLSRKLGVKSIAELTKIAIREGLTGLDRMR